MIVCRFFGRLEGGRPFLIFKVVDTCLFFFYMRYIVVFVILVSKSFERW